MKLFTEHQAANYIGDHDWLLVFRKRGLKEKCKLNKLKFYHQEDIDRVAWEWIFSLAMQRIMTIAKADGNPRSIASTQYLPLLVVQQIRTTSEFEVVLPEIFRKKIVSSRNGG